MSKKKPKKILKKDKKKTKKKRSYWKYALIVLAAILIGYFGYQAYSTFNSIWDQNEGEGSPFLNMFGDVQAGELKGEGDGRINVLIMGIPGGNHGGMYLSDTNIVASIDPINNKAAMLSLPRDLWVDIPGNGSSKLNAAHAYGENQEKGHGPTLMKQTVSQILDLPIHYYARVDFRGAEKLVDALGGIDIKVEKDIYDPYFPDQYGTGYDTYSIEAGQHHLNGVEALKYARSRYTTSDFDRAARQQQILVAVKKKLVENNLLLEPAKLIEIIGIAKDHFRTDLQPEEIKRLAQIIDKLNSEEITQKVLDNSSTGLLYSTRINGASVLLPKGDDFSQIQSLAHRIFTEPYIEQEAAKIEIQNGTNQVGLAGQAAEVLEDFGYKITKVADAKKKDYEKTIIVDYSHGEKPHTLDLLLKRIPGAQPMEDGFYKGKAEILLVLGSDFKIDDLYR